MKKKDFQFLLGGLWVQRDGEHALPVWVPGAAAEGSWWQRVTGLLYRRPQHQQPPPGLPKSPVPAPRPFPAAPAACYHPVICRVGASSSALFLAPSRRRLLWVPDIEERSRLSLLHALLNFLGFSMGCAAGRLFVTEAPCGLSHCTAQCCCLKSPSEAPGSVGSRIFFGTRLPGSPPR